MVSELVQRQLVQRAAPGPAAAHDAGLGGVVQQLAKLRSIVRADDALTITTDCLYPDLASVVVVVIGGARGETVVVHDDGGAAERLVIAGRQSSRLQGTLARVARRYGLRVDGEAIVSDPRPIADTVAIIRLVAAASQDAARELLAGSEPVVKRDLRGEVGRAVQAVLPDATVLYEHAVAGASSHSHWFDVFVPLANGATLLVDAVTPEPSSVNAAIVANMDVARRHDARFVQAIVFDAARREAFGVGSLVLLAEVATTVAIDDFQQQLPRLAA